MFISWWCLLALHFHWDLWKFFVLLQWEFKNACWTPSKNVTVKFFEMVLCFATAPAILFHHFNLRTVFAVISHTSAFRCMHRHCQALTYVMIIGLWLDRLPGSIFLQAFHQLSIVPVWASTFGLPRWTRHAVFVNWPLEWFTNSYVYDVTWSVFTEVQQKCTT